MNLTCIIVEDLQVAANYLMKCCEKSEQVEVRGHFLNVPDALSYLNENTVDLIFLDVEMPGANGFELLDQIAFSPKVILTTSKKEYAYNAFQYNVSDYLMKPTSVSSKPCKKSGLPAKLFRRAMDLITFI